MLFVFSLFSYFVRVFSVVWLGGFLFLLLLLLFALLGWLVFSWLSSGVHF